MHPDYKSRLEWIASEFPVIHISLGLIGNFCFFIGSILFFKVFDQFYFTAVTLFVLGSFLMLIGSIGDAYKALFTKRMEKKGKTKPN